jgi:peptidoglycan/LPS O-acetylase OafA/YrhL
MCYTINLYHCQIFSLLGSATTAIQITRIPLINFFITAGIVVPRMLVASSVLFVLFEKPCMRRDRPNRLASWFTRALQRVGLSRARLPSKTDDLAAK